MKCIVCGNADFSTVGIADYCGQGQAFVTFGCLDCSLRGPYGDEPDHRREMIIHNPHRPVHEPGRFWVDGGQSSEYCGNFVRRDDHVWDGTNQTPKMRRTIVGE